VHLVVSRGAVRRVNGCSWTFHRVQLDGTMSAVGRLNEWSWISQLVQLGVSMRIAGTPTQGM